MICQYTQYLAFFAIFVHFNHLEGINNLFYLLGNFPGDFENDIKIVSKFDFRGLMTS